MAKKSKLLNALDAHKGRDYRLENQRKLEKSAQSRKRKRNDDSSNDLEPDEVMSLDAGNMKHVAANTRPAGEVQLTNGTSNAHEANSSHGADISEDEVDEELYEDGTDEEADLPFSDLDSLASPDRADIVPFQRLTINNVNAIQSAQKTIALPVNLPFSAHQSLTTTEPLKVDDVNDDLQRELAFYTLCLEGAERGRRLLKDEGVPFSRPNDYFAEMVKSDEHMSKINQRMVEDAARKKASSDAKRQRDLKKFGKQVQVAKEQERAKAKRATLDKIDLLKKKRKNADPTATNEEDMFDVALDDSTTNHKSGRSGPKENAGTASKRRKKDAKFGFGGKKRFSKSGDAISSGDISGFSSKKMKNAKPKRLGKSRRTKKA